MSIHDLEIVVYSSKIQKFVTSPVFQAIAPYIKSIVQDDDTQNIFTLEKKDAPRITYYDTYIHNPEGLLFAIKYYIQKYDRHFAGIFLHASAIEYKNKAYVFIGDSGAGKTTIALNSKLPVIADDLCEIISTDNQLVISRSQLDISVESKHFLRSDILKYVPLTAIYFLYQSHVNRIVPITNEESISAIFQQTIWAHSEIERISPVEKKRIMTVQERKRIQMKKNLFFKLLVRLTKQVDCSKLYFTKNFQFNPSRF